MINEQVMEEKMYRACRQFLCLLKPSRKGKIDEFFPLDALTSPKRKDVYIILQSLFGFFYISGFLVGNLGVGLFILGVVFKITIPFIMSIGVGVGIGLMFVGSFIAPRTLNCRKEIEEYGEDSIVDIKQKKYKFNKTDLIVFFPVALLVFWLTNLFMGTFVK